MNFTFAKRDVWNTQILRDDDGTPFYETSTEDKTLILGRETLLFRLGADGSKYQIGQVIVGFELGGRKNVMVGGHEIVPTSYSFLNKDQSFKASNGQKYTWKVKGESFLHQLEGVAVGYSREKILELRNSQNKSVVQVSEASWDSKKNRPTTKLSLSPEVVEIADEIVALFIYMSGQKEKRNRSNVKQTVPSNLIAY
ncbi:hypothetical protein DL96DRAFT_1614482 [Flagelloscypha sp. PMI_526]|nr:hypothetical protein DL96DRAFT_1614482 [Flagelloscypha sp. PMI_526]